MENDFRTSGGMILMINKNIRQVVSILKNSNSEIQWLKLCKTFFDLNKDIYVCFVYMPPSTSSYAIRHYLYIMGTLCFDVMNYGKLGFLVICGDFNARTARETENVKNDKFVPLSSNDISFNLPARCSHDAVCIERGKDLIDLCISSDLQILIGRTFGDYSGKFTSFQYNGNSVVHYCLISNYFARSVFM